MTNNTTSKPPPQQSQTVRPRNVSSLRKKEVQFALRSLGADKYDLTLPETHYLPQLLRDEEIILGAVYGRYKKDTVPHTGRGVLVVTSSRLLLVNKKSLFLQYDDIRFDMVSGVQYNKGFTTELVTLNTRMGDIGMRTFNDQCAKHFVQVVEDMLCFRNQTLQQS